MEVSQYNEPTEMWNMLYFLPEYCVDSIATDLVAGFILTLSKHFTLAPVCLRVITKLFLKQASLFPCLKSLLSLSIDIHVHNMIKWNLAVSSTLKDICATCPDQYGEECLSYISKMLTLTNDPLCISLLISAITHLCNNGTIEPHIVWKLLSEKFMAVKK